MTVLASLKNIHLAFGQKIIFDGAEITINKGDRIGLIGLNGQGKSTLFKILAGEVNPDISNPPFIFDKNNESFSIFWVPQEVQLDLFKDLTIQNFYLSFYPNLLGIHRKLQELQTQISKNPNDQKLVKEQESLLGKFSGLGAWEIQNSYLSFLNSFGLASVDRKLTELSGGELKKLVLSSGLSARAELILWDEPTNHLDIDSIEQFEDELQSLKKTYIIISHDRYLLNHTTDRVFHIEHGKITSFNGTYLDYLEYLNERELELQKNLDKLQNRHRRELAWMRQGIKARGTRSKKRVENYYNIVENIKTLRARGHQNVNLNLQHSGRQTKILVEIKEGKFQYQQKLIFDELDLLVFKKDKIALIGPNGSGKTSLIKIIQGINILQTGKLKTAEQLKIVVFDQHRKSLDENKTPFQVIGEGIDHVILGNGQKRHINSYLEDFLFNSDQVNRPISSLSGGEKNRLQLAMFMKQAADLWVFDEPTNDLDIETIELLEKMLIDYEDSVIIIGHDRAFLDKVCQKTWLIHNHTIEIFTGGYSQVAPYLHAIEEERRFLEEEQKKKLASANQQQVAQPSISERPAMTYHEKRRWGVIEKDIENAEIKLTEASEKLAAFDYGDMNPKKQTEFKELNDDKMFWEKKVEELFAEWEELSKKKP